ncbi:hypothetical protein CK227_00255 [Mesorhizobium sp. WSM4308]|nr:hypothetical protein CK232_04560 [Mesorhizobium sp. WSM4304]PBB77035.1 hypothetical protein CK227_00255 [Mesorhizobium sp. WSM4308]
MISLANFTRASLKNRIWSPSLQLDDATSRRDAPMGKSPSLFIVSIHDVAFEHPAHHHDRRIDQRRRIGGRAKERANSAVVMACEEDAPIRAANLFYGSISHAMPRYRTGMPICPEVFAVKRLDL